MRKVLRNACKDLHMIAAAQEMVRHLITPTDWNSTKESRLAALARRLGFPFSRVKNIYLGRARRIDAHEWLRLEAEFEELRRSAQARQGRLHELEILERAATQAHRKATRPLGVEGGEQGAPRSGRQHRD